MKPHPEVAKWLAKNGRKGGKVKGPSKARSGDLARKAALARWAKNKENGEA